MKLPKISEQFMTDVVVPAATAGSIGYVAYLISSEQPVAVGVGSAAVSAYLVTR